MENVVERAVIVSQGKQLKLDEWRAPAEGEPETDEPAVMTLEEMERRYIMKVLAHQRGQRRGENTERQCLDVAVENGKAGD